MGSISMTIWWTCTVSWPVACVPGRFSVWRGLVCFAARTGEIIGYGCRSNRSMPEARRIAAAFVKCRVIRKLFGSPQGEIFKAIWVSYSAAAMAAQHGNASIWARNLRPPCLRWRLTSAIPSGCTVHQCRKKYLAARIMALPGVGTPCRKGPRRFTLWLVPSPHYSRQNNRGVSLSDRGQWASTLRRPANLSGEAYLTQETRASSKEEAKSACLHAPVPARYETHSSVYTLSCFSLVR